MPDDYYERLAHWSSSVRYTRELESLLGRLELAPGADLLDIGCGTGAALQFAFRSGYWVVGMDKAPTWHHCSTRPVVQADAACLPFRCGSFDGALLFHVLAHL